MATERDEVVAALRAELAAARAELAELKREVLGARERVELTMKAQLRCPGCGCRKILHATEILDRADMREKLSLAQPSIWSSRRVGVFEAFVCTRCGLVEWYVKDLAGLEVDGKKFQLLDGGEEAAPYR